MLLLTLTSALSLAFDVGDWVGVRGGCVDSVAIYDADVVYVTVV